MFLPVYPPLPGGGSMSQVRLVYVNVLPPLDFLYLSGGGLLFYRRAAIGSADTF